MRSVIAASIGLALCGWAGSLTATQQRQVAAIENRLLAPCCFKEPVGRHQSDTATQMRLEIARLVEAGKSEAEVVELYVQRHGPQVVAAFAPTPGYAHYIPWGLTAAGALALAWWVWRAVRSRKAAASHL